VSQERRLICVPPDDPAFVAAVEDAFATLGSAAQSDEELGAAVKASLKARYPGVRLRSRDTIAEYLPGEITWYVYRDRGPGEVPDGDHGRTTRR
jgi:hypothetical protein